MLGEGFGFGDDGLGFIQPKALGFSEPVIFRYPWGGGGLFVHVPSRVSVGLDRIGVSPELLLFWDGLNRVTVASPS